MEHTQQPEVIEQAKAAWCEANEIDVTTDFYQLPLDARFTIVRSACGVIRETLNAR